jgi:endonuclease/exonuclease/phosphatase (EEP) superfamily protein YafD
VAVLATVPLTAVTLSRLLGGGVTPLAQLAAFAPWAAVGWLLVLAGLLAGRWWRLGLVAGLVLVLHVAWLIPPLIGRDEAGGPSGGVPVRVLTLNVLFGRADLPTLVAAVERERVDVVALQELTPEFADRFQAAVAQRLPYRDVHPAPSASGSGIWSRWPLEPLGLLPGSNTTPQVRVQAPGAVAAVVTSVHTASPLPTRVAAWRRDLQELAGTMPGSGRSWRPGCGTPPR